MRASVAVARWEGALYGVTSGLSGAFLAVVALVAGLRAVDGDISIGELVAVVGLAQFVAEPMNLLTYLVAQLARSRASAQRIVEFLATPPLVLVGERSADGAPRLELDAVTFGPLDDVSFAVEPGRLVAVVADDPGDAAALISLLRAEDEPASGRVLLGGIPLTEQRIEESRAWLLVAEHHVDLFEGPCGRTSTPRAGCPTYTSTPCSRRRRPSTS
jgi:putative ABC transport system ATP-binding protein